MNDPRYVIVVMLDEPNATKDTYGYLFPGKGELWASRRRKDSSAENGRCRLSIWRRFLGWKVDSPPFASLGADQASQRNESDAPQGKLRRFRSTAKRGSNRIGSRKGSRFRK
jgi:hypothetical protein